jgi:DNA-directed RNA polymerase subunit H (RpoH/RPB5)
METHIATAEDHLRQCDIPESCAKLYQAYKMTVRMLQQRGYSMRPLTIDFLADLREFFVTREMTHFKNMSLIFDAETRASILVVAPLDRRMGKQQIKDLEELMDQHNWVHIVVLYQSSTPMADKSVHLLNSSGSRRIEMFEINELQAERVRLRHVPQHTLLTADEVAAIKKCYANAHFEKIYTCDPICRWYGGIVGNVFAIDVRTVEGNTYRAFREVAYKKSF